MNRDEEDNRRARKRDENLCEKGEGRGGGNTRK